MELTRQQRQMVLTSVVAVVAAFGLATGSVFLYPAPAGANFLGDALGATTTASTHTTSLVTTTVTTTQTHTTSLGQTTFTISTQSQPSPAQAVASNISARGYGTLSAIAIDSATGRVYYGSVSQSSQWSISVFDTATDTVLASVPIGPLSPVSYNPQISAVAVNPATDMIYIGESGGIVVLDGHTNTIAASVHIAGQITEVAVDQSSDRVYAGSLDSGAISVINGGTNEIVANVTVGSNPSAMAVNSVTHMLYVVNNTNRIINNTVVSIGTMWVVNGSTDSVAGTVAIGSVPGGVAVDPETNMVYLSDRIAFNSTGGLTGGLTVVNGATNKVVSNLVFQPGSGDTGPVAVDPATNLVYVASCNYGVQVVNGSTNQALGLVPLGGCPFNVVIDTASHVAFALCTISASIVAIRFPSP